MRYEQTEWLLFFYLYCVIGWIWESCFVSVQNRTWINRGFLYGPWLPIYGIGAIMVLFSTLPVQDTLSLIFLVGMTSATILEYVAGAVMERIFHVRYWDYSTMRFHLNGYICLRSSLGWGCFSIALVRAIHPPIEKLILSIPSRAAEPLSLCLTILFMVDITNSVQSALDLKELLAKLSEGKRKLGTGNIHFNEAAAQISRRSAQLKAKFQELQQAVRTDRGLRWAVSILKRNPGASSKKYQDAIAVLRSLKPDRHIERNDATTNSRSN